LSEKAAEVALPHDAHPFDRNTGPSSPLPPSIQEASFDLPRPSGDQSGSSPESKKHNKLKKKEVGGAGGGGFRKMFGRKKETKPPPNASENANGGQSLQSGGNASLGRRFSGFRKKNLASPTSEHPPSLAPTPAPISEDEITPIASPQQAYERSYEPSVQESLSRVDTNDAREAHNAFSSFDQGPLDDVPAFVPESPLTERQSEDSDAAMPPPINKHRSNEGEGAELTKEVSPIVSDRWAQIRKNAAERAARQSEDQSRGGYSAKTDVDDGETSGEESEYPQLFLKKNQKIVLTSPSNRVPSG